MFDCCDRFNTLLYDKHFHISVVAIIEEVVKVVCMISFLVVCYKIQYDEICKITIDYMDFQEKCLILAYLIYQYTLNSVMYTHIYYI